jgi:hypothetical protein
MFRRNNPLIMVKQDLFLQDQILVIILYCSFHVKIKPLLNLVDLLTITILTPD